MWKRIAISIGRFIIDHKEVLIILAQVILCFIMYEIYKFKSSRKSFLYYRIEKINRRKEILENKCIGKKPMRKLKILNKYLVWKKEHLLNELKITNLKLKNTNEILTKYSWE